MSKPSPSDMRALTLWQPWASLVASGLKRIENRPWAPPGWLLNRRFAIHGGMKYSRDDAVTAEALGGNPLPKDQCPSGAILATCRLIAVARSETEAIRFTEDQSQARWYFGPYGWVLDEIRELPKPIECRGFQGLWRIPEDLMEKHASAFA